MADSKSPSSAQWPQDNSVALGADVVGLDLVTGDPDETYVLSDTPNSAINLLPIDGVTLVVDA